MIRLKLEITIILIKQKADTVAVILVFWFDTITGESVKFSVPERNRN